MCPGLRQNQWLSWRPDTGLSPQVKFILTVPRRYFFHESFVLFMSCVCHALASVYCCLVVTYLDRAGTLALAYDV